MGPWDLARAIRPARLFVVLAIALSLLGAGGPGVAMAGQRDATDLLDLAAMALQPADVDPDDDDRLLGIYDAGRIDSVVPLLSRLTGVWSEEEPEAIVAAGMVAVFYITIWQETEPDTQVLDFEYTSTHVQFDDAEGAAAAFAFFAAGVEPIATDADEVEEADEWFVVPSPAPDRKALIFVARVDRIILSVDVEYAREGEPEIDEVTALGITLVDRAEAVLERDAPELGSRLLRLERESPDPAEDEVTFDRYRRLDGVDLYAWDDDNQSVANLETQLGEAIDAYHYRQTFAYPVSGGQFAYLARLYRFEDEETAAEFVEEIDTLIADDVQVTSVEAIEGGTELGDQSRALAIAGEFSSGTYLAHAVVVQIGELVARVQVAGQEAPSLDGVIGLAEQQVTCLTDGGCAEPLPVPTDLRDLDGPDESVGGSEPAATDEEETDERDEAPADGDVGVYASPNYGFVLEYDAEEWEIYEEDDDPDDRYDRIVLTNGSSLVALIGDPDYSANQLDECVADYAAFLDADDTFSEVEPLDERDAEGAETDRVWATYSYRSGDGQSADDYVAYFECRWLGDGVTLGLIHLADADAYADESEARDDLLAGLTPAE